MDPSKLVHDLIPPVYVARNDGERSIVIEASRRVGFAAGKAIPLAVAVVFGCSAFVVLVFFLPRIVPGIDWPRLWPLWAGLIAMLFGAFVYFVGAAAESWTYQSHQRLGELACVEAPEGEPLRVHLRGHDRPVMIDGMHTRLVQGRMRYRWMYPNDPVTRTLSFDVVAMVEQDATPCRAKALLSARLCPWRCRLSAATQLANAIERLRPGLVDRGLRVGVGPVDFDLDRAIAEAWSDTRPKA